MTAKTKAAAKKAAAKPRKPRAKTPDAASKGGRPPADIDEQMVRKLARIYCTHTEIAQVLGCCAKTLQRRFAEIIEAERAHGKESLRRAQFKVAVEGENPTMLIWLGKQLLEQRDVRVVVPADPATELGTLLGLSAAEIEALRLDTPA